MLLDRAPLGLIRILALPETVYAQLDIRW